VIVELYLDRLDVGQDEVSRLSALLDADEIARAARFRHMVHKTRFIVRRARLRQWLGDRLGIAPAAVHLVAGAMGKPFVPGWDGQFSASHSRDMMAIAGGPVPLGCDIEAIGADIDWRPIAERLFAPEERHTLLAMAEKPGRIAFHQCWARKEAFVKALGLGLAYRLDAFAVSCDSPAALLRGGDGWHLAAVDVPGHAVAIAAKVTHGSPCATLAVRVVEGIGHT
jgi:4'-phosphopantetheinyl transferase